MRKRLQAMREKLGIQSFRAIVHIVIVEVLINLVWNWVSRMFSMIWVREVGFLVLTLAVLFAVALYLPKISPMLSGGSKANKKQPTQSWLNQVLQDDKDNLGRKIHRENYIWSLRGLKNTDSFMEVVIPLINANVFPILVDGVKGRFLVNREECAQSAEMEGRTRIPHGELGNIRIKQHISQQMMNSILLNREETLNISLQSCKLEIHPEIPGEQSKPINITLGEGHVPMSNITNV